MYLAVSLRISRLKFKNPNGIVSKREEVESKLFVRRIPPDSHPRPRASVGNFEILSLLVNLLIKKRHQSLHRIIAVAVVVLHRVDTTYLHTTTNSLGSRLRRDLPLPASR